MSVVLNLRTTENLILQLSNSNSKETMRSPPQLAKKKKIIFGGKERVLGWMKCLVQSLFFFLPMNNSAVHIPHLNGVLVARVCIRIPLKATPGHFTHQVKTKCFGSREAQNCWEVPLKMKYVIPLKPYSVQSMVKSWWWLAAVCHLLQWVTNRRTLLLLGAR